MTNITVNGRGRPAGNFHSAPSRSVSSTLLTGRTGQASEPGMRPLSSCAGRLDGQLCSVENERREKLNKTVLARFQPNERPSPRSSDIFEVTHYIYTIRAAARLGHCSVMPLAACPSGQDLHCSMSASRKMACHNISGRAEDSAPERSRLRLLADHQGVPGPNHVVLRDR